MSYRHSGTQWQKKIIDEQTYVGAFYTTMGWLDMSIVKKND